MLSILLFLPMLFMFIVMLLPQRLSMYCRWIALAGSIVTLGVATYMAFLFDKSRASYQFFEKSDWISVSLGSFGRISIDYCLGVDGISLSLVLLTAAVFFIAMLSSNVVQTKLKAYYMLMLLLETAIIGCFISLDLFLFYLFFELMLLPMYFLIGLWGGPKKEYAAIKFFIYTLVGSVFILLAFIAIYVSGFDPVESTTLRAEDIVHTFRIDVLSVPGHILQNTLLAYNNTNLFYGYTYRECAFLLLFFGFVIKLPAAPFHTWLPDAHVEATTPVSIILAALLLKVGAYGILRIAFPIFPVEAQHFSLLVSGLGVFSVFWGAYNALAQNDLKKMVAYSSVSHMGYVLIGLASFNVEAVSGAVYQLVSHGLLSASLFLIAGVLYHRTGNRNIDAYKGLAHIMPYYTVAVTVTFFASIGLPGFSGFISELLIFLGSFSSSFVPRYITILAVFAMLLTAGYYLWTLQRMFFSKTYLHPSIQNMSINDLAINELIAFVLLLSSVFLLGVYPNFLLSFIQQTCIEYVEVLSNSTI